MDKLHFYAFEIENISGEILHQVLQNRTLEISLKD